MERIREHCELIGAVAQRSEGMLICLLIKWSTFAVLAGHSSSVSALAAIALPGTEEGGVNFLVLTGGSDGSVHSWQISDSGAGQYFLGSFSARILGELSLADSGSILAVLLQKFDLKGKLPLDMALSFLPSSQSQPLRLLVLASMF